MKTLVKLEEFGEFLFSIYLFSLLPYPWWFYPLFFFAPDLSMLGYIAGPRLGAATYNVIHHKAIDLGLFVAGALLHIPIISFAGVICLGHSSLDRVLGYGLKHSDSFNHTHLGTIGRHQSEEM
jgi:hypothetical protein